MWKTAMWKTTMWKTMWTVGVVLTTLGVAWASTTAGSLDASFGMAGIASIPGTPQALAVKADDGSVTVRNALQQDPVTLEQYNTWVVERFTPRGVLDTSFGTNGSFVVESATSQGQARSIAVAPDGQIYVGGDITRIETETVTTGKGKKKTTTTVETTIQSGAILRLQADGTKDWFVEVEDTGQFVDLETPANAASYEIVAATTTLASRETTVIGRNKKPKIVTTESRAVTLLRLDPNGSVLSTWVDDVTEYGDDPIDVEVDGEGRTVVGFRISGSSGSTATFWALTRYDASGNVDLSFGTAGRIYGDNAVEGTIERIAIDVDGESVVAAGHGPNTPASPTLRRYDANGALDTVFPVANLGLYDAWMMDVAVDDDGNVYSTVWYGDTDWDVAVLRFTSGGFFDATWGPNGDGVSEILDLATEDRPGPMALDSQGRVLMGGAWDQTLNDATTGPNSILVRWLGSGN